MKGLKKLVLCVAFACGAAVAVAPLTSYAEDKAEPAKCDKAGKPCKDGKDCKAENCKKEEKK